MSEELSCKTCGTTENVEYGICSFCEEEEQEREQ